ncbi:MAG: hypothetical protein ACR2MS_12790 [Weeksellaceae bacterium]
MDSKDQRRARRNRDIKEGAYDGRRATKVIYKKPKYNTTECPDCLYDYSECICDLEDSEDYDVDN